MFWIYAASLVWKKSRQRWRLVISGHVSKYKTKTFAIHILNVSAITTLLLLRVGCNPRFYILFVFMGKIIPQILSKSFLNNCILATRLSWDARDLEQEKKQELCKWSNHISNMFYLDIELHSLGSISYFKFEIISIIFRKAFGYCKPHS